METTGRATLGRTVVFGTLLFGTLMLLVLGHWLWVRGLLTVWTVPVMALVAYGSGLIWSVLFWFLGVRSGIGKRLSGHPNKDR